MSKLTFALAFMSATLFQAADRREEKGATAVEYGLLIALMAAIVIAAVTLLGDGFTNAFTDVRDDLMNN